MLNPDNLCMGCMREIGEEKQCPYCGFHADSPQLAPYLPLRTVISGRYLVGKLLDYNGDGATYIGWDLTQKTPVQIREFLPDAIVERKPGDLTLQVLSGCEITYRDCYQSFLELWRKLVRMRGLSALIVAFDIVEDYNTAYAISEYMEGVTLREFLLRSETGYLSWEQARGLFMPVLSTLGNLHSSGIIHRGISPTTLIIGRDGKMRISGFSIWQARTARGDLTAQLYAGYAAIEQYGFDGQQGPWTDIYSFAAVLYRTLVGSTPLEATARVTNDKMMVPAKFAEQIPAYVINALVNALQILPEDRTRSVELLRAELSASPSAVNATTKILAKHPADQSASAPQKEEALKKSRRTLALKAAGMSVAVCVAIVLILALIFRDQLFSSDPAENTIPETNLSEQANAPLTVGQFVSRPLTELQNSSALTGQYNFIVREAYSDKAEAGIVIEQSIQPGEKVSRTGGKVDIVLTVSKGPEKVVLPTTLIGLDREAALAQLNALGLTNIQFEEVENDGTQTANVVVAVTPGIGSEVEKNTQIILDIRKPAPGLDSTAGTKNQTAR